MSIPLVINGQLINFPSSASDPNWSPAIIQFAQAVTDALSSVVGPFDIQPQIYTMVANTNSNVDIPNLAFPTSNVRGAFIRYAVFRQTDTNKLSESGNIIVVFNASKAPGLKWEIVRDYAQDAQITFAISDVGQISFSTTNLSGPNHTGTISFTAQSLLNS